MLPKQKISKQPMVWMAMILAMVLTLTAVQPAMADYEAGQKAWVIGQRDVALASWQDAAAQGDRRAMLALGRLYFQGLGVLQDFIEAHKWFNLAASRGDGEAAQERETLAQKMTIEQVAEAQARASNWQPGGEGKIPAILPASEPAESAADSISQDTDIPSEESISQEPQTTSAPQTIVAEAETVTEGTGTPSRETTLEVQELLTILGYAPGPVDGVWGARTAESYQTFLSDSGMLATESVTLEAINAMRAQAEIRSAESAQTETSLTQQLLQPQSVATPSTSSPGVGETITTVAEFVIKGIYMAKLLETINDAESLAQVTPELQELLVKMFSDISSNNVDSEQDFRISLDALSTSELGRLPDLLENDRVLPALAKNALSDALQVGEVQQEPKSTAVYVPEPKCAEKGGTGNCWFAITNIPKCHVWLDGVRDEYPYSILSFTWSGGCSDGKASGTGNGSYTTVYNNEELETQFQGQFLDGKEHGHWVFRYDDGSSWEGQYLNGEKFGRWVIRDPDGSCTLIVTYNFGKFVDEEGC